MCFRLCDCRTSALALAIGLLALSAWATAPAVAQTQSNEKLWGGIEIGSSGVKASVLEEQTDAGHVTFKERAKKDLPGQLTANIERVKVKDVERNKFATDSIDRTVKDVGDLHGWIRNSHPDVPLAHIFVVVSSGVVSIQAVNYEDFGKEVKKIDGIKELAFIDDKAEVKWGFLWILRGDEEKYRAGALYIDIGGGDTKFGFVTQDDEGKWTKPIATSVKYGSNNKTLLKAVEEPKRDLPGLRKAIVDELQKKIVAIPALRDRVSHPQKIYLNGGAAWVMAVLEGKWPTKDTKDAGEDNTLVRVDRKTMIDFCEAVRGANPYHGVDNGPEWQKEFKRVPKNFANAQRLMAAGEMLQAVFEAFSLGKKDGAEIWFVPNGHVAWINGYIEGKRLEEVGRRPASQDTLDQAVNRMVTELNKEHYPEKLDKRLQAISEALSGITQQLGKLNEPKSPPPPPPVVDLKPILKELQEIQQAIRAIPAPIQPPPSPDGHSGVKEAGATDSGGAARHFSRGLELYLHCRMEEALLHFDAASRQDPGVVSYWYGRALAEDRLGLQQAARNSAWQVAEAYRTDAEAHARVALAFERIQGPERDAINGYIRDRPLILQTAR